MEMYTSFIIGNTCFVTAEVFSKWVSLKEQDSKKKKKTNAFNCPVISLRSWNNPQMTVSVVSHSVKSAAFTNCDTIQEFRGKGLALPQAMLLFF